MSDITMKIDEECWKLEFLSLKRFVKHSFGFTCTNVHGNDIDTFDQEFHSVPSSLFLNEMYWRLDTISKDSFFLVIYPIKQIPCTCMKHKGSDASLTTKPVSNNPIYKWCS